LQNKRLLAGRLLFINMIMGDTGMGKKRIYMLFLVMFFLSITYGVANASPNEEIKQSNVKGVIKENGSSLGDAVVFIREKGKLNWIQTMTDSNGVFKTKLHDGTFVIKGVREKNKNWYSTNETFVVSEGKIVGLNDGEIVLSQMQKEKKISGNSGKIKGKLKEGNNGLQADLIISKYSENEEEIIRVSSEANGNFSATLSDGNYFLFGVEVDGGFYRYELGFSVVNGNVTVDGNTNKKLSINLPINTFSGKVEDATTPLIGANIVIEKRLSEDEYNTEFIQSVITDHTGAFSLRALTDGKYSLSVYHETYYSWNHLMFEVINGKIHIDGLEASILQISIPDINVSGQVLEGELPISNAFVEFESQTDEGYDWYNTQTDENGSFQYRLEDGMYTIRYIDERNRRTEFSIPFEIRDGKLFQNGNASSLISINLPPVTLNGKLVESGTTLQGSVWITNDGTSEGFNAQTDENGVFSLRLKDGTYRVSNGFLNEDGEQITFNTTFDIINGELMVNGKEQSLLELQVPGVSLHGLVKDGDRVVTSGLVSVTSDQQGADIWKDINPDGTFTMRLTDGNYYIRSIQIEDGSSTEVFQPFTVMNGKTYENDELKDVLEISVPPITLMGKLSEGGTPIIGGLYIMEINDADNPLQFWGTTNEDGEFQFRMLDGDYMVYNVNLPDGSNFSPGIEFSIRSGQLYMNGEMKDQLNIDVPQVTLSGNVFNGEEPVNQGYLSITLLEGEFFPGSNGEIQDGHYQVRLHDGEYEISYIYDYQYGYYEIRKRFAIVNGKLFVDGQEISTLDINLQDSLQ
jgi:hypothetical protein